MVMAKNRRAFEALSNGCREEIGIHMTDAGHRELW